MLQLRRNMNKLSQPRKQFLKVFVILAIWLAFILWLSGNKRKYRPDPIWKAGGDSSDWQNVGFEQDKTFSVYSAYAFPGASNKVEIITSYKRFPDGERVRCKFYFDDEIPKREVETDATIDRIHGWDYVADFTGHQVQCPLPVGDPRPKFVSVLIGEQSDSPARVKIQYKKVTSGDNRKYDFTFSVCVKPVHNGTNELLHFLEWFEFYKLMGVQQFTFYNMSMGHHLGCLMTHLQKDKGQPEVNILAWNHYPVLQDVQWPNTFEGKGKSEVFQDCLFRHKGGGSEYLINVDLDEFIMPREENVGYPELLQKLETTYQNHSDNRIGEYVFKNGFFILDRVRSANVARKCGHLKDNGLSYKICQKLWIVEHVRREPYHLFGQRTKNIFKPEAVKVLLNHVVGELEPGFRSLNVPPEIAFSRHYRYFEKGKRFKIDKIDADFGGKLAENVAVTLEGAMNACDFKETDLF